jgi:hypothetical protein
MMASGENNDTYDSAGRLKPNELDLGIIDAQTNYEANMYYTSSSYVSFAEHRPISSFSVIRFEIKYFFSCRSIDMTGESCLHKSNGSSVNYRLCKIHLILNICF